MTFYFRWNDGAHPELIQTPSASLLNGPAFLRYFANSSAMDIWAIKYRAMWRARLYAVHVMLMSALLILAFGDGRFCRGELSGRVVLEGPMTASKV
jgi:hypothetical protein